MDTLIGSLALLGLLFINIVALAAGRYAAARAFRIEKASFPFGDGPPQSYDRASRWARPAMVVAGSVANYLCAATLMFLGFLLTGEMKPTRTTVNPIPERPAAIAGMRNGDRVLAMNGGPIETWEQITTTVQSNPGEPIDVLVDRGGEKLHIEVTPSHDGRIGVTPISERAPVSVTKALWLGISGPPPVIKNLGSGLIAYLTGRVEGELAGPAGIAKETARVGNQTGDLLLLLGALNAYFLPIILFVSALTLPRRQKFALAPADRGPGP